MEGNRPFERPTTSSLRGDRAAEPEPGLIEACRRGEREAFCLLFESCKDSVYAIARNFTGDDAGAHDVTQEVFLKLFAAIRGYRGQSQFRTWLYRLVVNVCVDEHRRRRRFIPAGPARAPAPAPTLDDRLSRREIERQVQTALLTLSPRLRLVLLLRHVEGLSYEEIAAASGCSPGTVASRLNRGHRHLARRLAHLRGAL
jgi:RNA polymerase sigma-70 factor (ECF subfamily)